MRGPRLRPKRDTLSWWRRAGLRTQMRNRLLRTPGMSRDMGATQEEDFACRCIFSWTAEEKTGRPLGDLDFSRKPFVFGCGEKRTDMKRAGLRRRSNVGCNVGWGDRRTRGWIASESYRLWTTFEAEWSSTNKSWQFERGNCSPPVATRFEKKRLCLRSASCYRIRYSHRLASILFLPSLLSHPFSTPSSRPEPASRGPPRQWAQTGHASCSCVPTRPSSPARPQSSSRASAGAAPARCAAQTGYGCPPVEYFTLVQHTQDSGASCTRTSVCHWALEMPRGSGYQNG